MSSTSPQAQLLEEGWESDSSHSRSPSPHSRSRSRSRSPSPSSHFILHETALERIRALKDMVDPLTRYHISRFTSKTVSKTSAIVTQIGRVMWVVATTGLVVGVPLVWSLNKEGATVFESDLDVQKRGRELLEGNKESTPFNI